MINIFEVQENKVTKNLNVYPMVIMGETGDGKTFSLNEILRSLSDGEKKPLFIMLEDRYQHIPNIKAVRVRSVADLEMVKNQLKSPQAKDLYSCVVMDTADKLDVLLENFVASSKEVEITGDLNFGKGNKYIKNRLFFIDELRNNGWTVHFVMQCYKNTNIITQQTTYDHKLNKETWSKISHDAYLIGMLSVDKKGERYISFKKTNEYHLLKDSIGMPDKVKVSEFKTNLENSILNIKDADFTDENTITNVQSSEVSFEDILNKGNALGGLLANNGHLDEAMFVLKTNIGQNEDGSPKFLDSLNPTQIDLATVVVLKLEELVQKYNLK